MKSNTSLFLICAIVWGLTWFAIKHQLPSVDSSAAVFYRFLFSSSILFFLCFYQKYNLKFTFKYHLRFVAQGLLLFCLNFLLSYYATSLAPSALVSLAFTSLIFFNMFGAKLFLKIPFETKVAWGALISFAGMVFVSINELQHQDLHPLSIVGFLISLVATISASAGNLFSTTNKKHNIPVLVNNAYSMLYGALLTLIFVIIVNKPLQIHFTTSFVISFLYLSLFGSVLSFWAYLKLIENIGPSKAAFTSVVSPIIALSVSSYFENLEWTWMLFIGAFLCVAGNIIALVNIPKFKLQTSRELS